MGLLDFLFAKKKVEKKPVQYNQPIMQKAYIERGQVNTVSTNVSIDNIDNIKNEFIAIDLETTGLSCEIDKIIEVGAVKFVNGNISERYGSLIKIDMHIPESATRVNNITDSMLDSIGKEPTEVYRELSEFLKSALNGKSYVVAHNASFDMSFLSKALGEYGYSGTLNYLDTLKISRATIKGLENYKQPTVASHFGIVNSAEHRAVSDAEVCGIILANLLKIQEIEIKEEKQRQIEKAERAALNEEEKEIGAIILNILKNNGADISKIRFYKNSANYIDMNYVYNLWKYKVSKKGNYIILPSDKIKGISLKTEQCTKSEGECDNIRVYFDTPFELETISDILTEVYKEFITNGNVYDNFNKYEKEFFANANMTEITDILVYIEKAKQRIDDNAKLQEKSKAQEIEKQRQQEEKKRAKQQKLEQEEQQKLANEELERERERIRKQLLDNDNKYTIDMIKSIAEISKAEKKRAVIKLDDNGDIHRVYESLSDACCDVGLAPKTIRDVCNGKGKHAGGFVWKYADEYIVK